jgi:phosphoribosylformimino-5-aminoimidazole carboxamide ribotide isomerase
MHIIPAIDIQGGHVVRHAGAGVPTVYRADPVAAADGFLAQGAAWLHVVDLDRAFDTGRDNDEVIRRIAALPRVRVQVGGRLRRPEHLAAALELGAARAVVATGAAADGGIWKSIVAVVEPARLAVAADVRRGALADRGSNGPLALSADLLVRRATGAGVRTLVHRDLERDGGLAGADVAGAAGLLGLGADVIAAGGFGSLDDLRAARRAGLTGVIVGRALHEGRFTLREALAC